MTDNRPAGGAIRLAVCIDDIGMHAGVNAAALELGASGRVSAVSCMVDGPAWRPAAADLVGALRGQVDIGLHLDFTEPFPQHGGRRTLRALIVAAYAGRLSPRQVAAEVRRQFDAFEDAAGAPPDFVDGHQHVHQLPIIREALMAELARRYPNHTPWIRNTAPPASGRLQLKPHIIGLLGAAGLRRAARLGGYRQNRHLLGVYGFAGTAADYRLRVQGWLAQAQDRDVLMCHPANGGDDALAQARQIEYAFYRGDDFTQLLQEYRVTLARLSTL
jgi:predicted glycoside hydrolase/deacetylase ChbG (UPF0249 family)